MHTGGNKHTHRGTLSSLQLTLMGARAVLLDARGMDEFLAWGQTHSALLLGSEKKKKKAFMHRHLMVLILHYSIGSILDQEVDGSKVQDADSASQCKMQAWTSSSKCIYQVSSCSSWSPVPCWLPATLLWQLSQCLCSSSSTLGSS